MSEKIQFINLGGKQVRPEKVAALWEEIGGYNGNGGWNHYLYAIIDGVQVTLSHNSSYSRDLQVRLERYIRELEGV